jgi:phosphoribosylglycinamide formyltransferase-1
MIKIAILGSTNGSDLKYIFDAYHDKILDPEKIQISLIISNRNNAGILEKGIVEGIPTKYITSSGKTRDEYDSEISQICQDLGIHYILLIGYMRILTNKFVETWRGKCVNIHPSLLPAFAGAMDLNVHQAVLDRGCKITGATLMYIDDGADTGPIIDQACLRVADDETVDSLKVRVQELEGELLVSFLSSIS